MQKQTKILISALLVLVLTLSLASAMTVKSVDAENFSPGNEQDITVKVKNTLSTDAFDVSLTLNMGATSTTAALPFAVINSGDVVDEISSDDSENFDFTIKALASAKSGDYSIPYTITYSNESGDQQDPITGTFTLTIEANPELAYSVSTDMPVVGRQGKITLNLVNKGLGDAKFVSVTLIPNGYTLLSDDNDYIGTMASDDTETASFDVLFTQQNPTLAAEVQYRDFNNKLVTDTVSLPITVYSQDQALKLGLIQTNNTFTYIIILAVVVIGYLIVRRIRKRRRLNKAQGR